MLRGLLDRLRKLYIFLHDSERTYENMFWEVSERLELPSGRRHLDQRRYRSEHSLLGLLLCGRRQAGNDLQSWDA